MEERTVKSWRDLTLLQLGTLLRSCTVNRNRRLYKEWFLLVNQIGCADAAYRGRRTAGKGPDFKLNTTQALLAYFFTYAAAVHHRFLHPDQELCLKEIVPEYHLDLLSQNPFKRHRDFTSHFGAVIPHKGIGIQTLSLSPSELGDALAGVKWTKRTDAECAGMCWEQLLRYMEECDAPLYSTRAEDAFAWLEEKNRHAYKEITNAYGERLFDCRYECEMGETYQRFLRQLDNWDPVFLRLWAAFQRNARVRFRELSAVLNATPEDAPAQGGDGHV